MTIRFDTPVVLDDKPVARITGTPALHPHLPEHGFRSASLRATRLPALQSQLPDRSAYRELGKAVLDYTLILLALPIVVPVIALLALLACLDGKAPFYRQQRVGRNGRIFHILKIQTMVPDADRKLHAYLEANPEARQEWDHKQKLTHDPRITWIGAIMRKTSLDELPQLWNVLTRDMSLVGPRPMMPHQEMLYPGSAYYRMHPGITGLWQVSDRNESSFAERASFDTEYFHKLSLKTDIAILFRTIGVVLRGTGC